MVARNDAQLLRRVVGVYLYRKYEIKPNGGHQLWRERSAVRWMPLLGRSAVTAMPFIMAE